LERPALSGNWRAAGWEVPDPTELAVQHEAFCELLAGLGCHVEVAPALEGLVDACYMHDPFIMCDSGAVLLQQVKPVRRDEPAHAARELERRNVPVLGTLEGNAIADGGDTLWLDERTLAIGAGYRTNAEGQRQLGQLLAGEGVQVEAYDLPHGSGPDSVLHLMSFVSPVTENLCVVHEPLAPVRFLEALRERDFRWVQVSREEFDRLGSNVLAVRPGVTVMADGAPETHRALEANGCEVHVYEGSEISHKGAGGPTCLTAPLLRETA
jgi:dimethylargininase